MNKNFEANFAATAIGSFPHDNISDACNLIQDTLPEVPCWPQLTARGIYEEMCIQYTENLPGFEIDFGQKIGILEANDKFNNDLETFYKKYMEKDVNYFAITEKYGSGFHAMIKRLEDSDRSNMIAVKGQIVGPITLAGITKDREKIASIYNDICFDAIVKTLAMKATWQLEQFERFDIQRIIFVDEPYLASIGSAFANIDKGKVISSLNEVFSAIHEKDGLAGIHCCGNTDWSMLIETTIDIINFDAFGYMDSLILYWKEVKSFLERGGILAWGIVPTSDEIEDATLDDLISKMNAGIKKLADNGIDPKLIFRNSLVTPSCGTGSLDIKNAEKAMQLTKSVSMKLKETLG